MNWDSTEFNRSALRALKSGVWHLGYHSIRWCFYSIRLRRQGRGFWLVWLQCIHNLEPWLRCQPTNYCWQFPDHKVQLNLYSYHDGRVVFRRTHSPVARICAQNRIADFQQYLNDQCSTCIEQSWDCEVTWFSRLSHYTYIVSHIR